MGLPQVSVPFSPEQASTFAPHVDALYAYLVLITIFGPDFPFAFDDWLQNVPNELAGWQASGRMFFSSSFRLTGRLKKRFSTLTVVPF